MRREGGHTNTQGSIPTQESRGGKKGKGINDCHKRSKKEEKKSSSSFKIFVVVCFSPPPYTTASVDVP
jgi:hypothetical protein